MPTKLLGEISQKFTEDLLIKIIEDETGLKDVRVEQLQMGDGQKKGDSYLSSVTKFVAKGCGVEKSSGKELAFSVPIFTKALIKNIARRKTFRSTDFFRNEVNFFNKVWPSLVSFQESKDIQKPFLKIPRCFAAVSDGESDFIALEDLSYQEYETSGRAQDLDLESAKLILQVFAQFHALNLAYKDQRAHEYEELISCVEETYFAEKYRNWYSNFQASLFVVIKDAVKKHLSRKYLDKIEELIATDFYGELVRMAETREPLSVINHGDAWAPNFLFRYDKNKPISAMMIDFQLSRFSPLSMDITFFLFSCTTKSLRDDHWDEMIEYYHSEFVEMIQQLGSSVSLLTLEQLRADIKKNAKFGIGMTFEALPMSLLDDNDISDPDSLQGNDAVPLESVLVVHPLKSEEKTRRIADFIQEVVDRELI